MGLTIQGASSNCPWKEGIWWNKKEPKDLRFVNNQEVKVRNAIYFDYPDYSEKKPTKETWTYGKYHKTNEKISNSTKSEYYNVRLQSWFTVYGVLSKEGTKLYVEGFIKGISSHEPYYLLEWVSEAEIETFKENRQSALAPLCPFVVPNPDQEGKLIWLTGPPGSGKSITSQYFAKTHGFIHYQGDCFTEFLNPFTDLEADEATLSQMMQVPLQDVPESTYQAVMSASDTLVVLIIVQLLLHT